MRGNRRLTGRVARAAAMVLAGAAAVVGATPAGPAAATPSSGFHVLAPAQILDTRVAPATKLAAGVERSITVAGQGGVPVGATRAAVRIFAVEGAPGGEVRVHACGAYDPAGRVLLALTSEPDAGLAFVGLTAGAFCVTSTAAVHLVVQTEGYEDATPGGAAFVSTLPLDAAVARPVAAGGVLTVDARTPAGAVAASVEIIAEDTGSGYLVVYACDQPRPLASSLPLVAGAVYATTAVAPLSASGTLCVYASTVASVTVVVHGSWQVGATPTAIGPAQYAVEAVREPGFVPVTPKRLFDTRNGGGRIPADQAKELDLNSEVPATATDVVMNVTVTDPVAAGFLTVYPCDTARPVVSNLNFVAGQTVPNLVTVSLGVAGKVCFAGNVATHVVADLAGWYQDGAGDGFVPVTPARLFDTRTGRPRLATGETYTLDLTSTVSTDASAVVLNVTVTEPTAAGYLTAYPCDAPRPLASNLNFVAGQTVPNLVTVAVGSTRKVCLYTSAPAHLLADLGGWYAASSKVGYVGQAPSRELDTREDGLPVEAGGHATLAYGPGNAIPDAVVAVVLNLTAVNPEGAGYVTAYPCAVGRPTVSNVNFRKGDIVPNLAVVSTDADDTVCFYSPVATDVIADVAGYFTLEPTVRAVLVD